MPRAVRPSLRDPRFRLLVAGETVNSIGGWASAIVLWGFAAYRCNASPYAVSVTIVCWAAPPAVLSPLMGIYVDRLGPRKALVAGYLAAAAAALAMAAADSLAELEMRPPTASPGPWRDRPPAPCPRGSSPPMALFGAVALTTVQRLTPRAAHGRIMGLTATIQSGTETIGLPLAGVTLAVLGIRAGALALAGVAVTTGMICLAIGARTSS
jgi:MFS family permease